MGTILLLLDHTTSGYLAEWTELAVSCHSGGREATTTPLETLVRKLFIAYIPLVAVTSLSSTCMLFMCCVCVCVRERVRQRVPTINFPGSKNIPTLLVMNYILNHWHFPPLPGTVQTLPTHKLIMLIWSSWTQLLMSIILPITWFELVHF